MSDDFNDTVQFRQVQVAGSRSVRKSAGMDARTSHYDRVLTNMSVAIQQEKDGFICGQVFNTVPTEDKSDVFASYPPEYQLRHGFKERSEGSESQAVTWKASFDKSYNCKVYAAKVVIGKQLQSNASAPLNPTQDALELLSEHALIFKDEVWVASFFKTGVWTDLTGVANGAGSGGAGAPSATEFIQFSDYTNSNPILVVEDQRVLFKQKNGRKANFLVMGAFVYSKLKNHPKVLERVLQNFATDGATPAKANLQTLAMLFEVDQVLVADAIHDTGTEGATLAPTYIAGKHMLLGHTQPRTNLKMPMAGGYFCWTGYEPGANNMGVVVDQWFNRDKKVYLMEMELAFDMKVVASSLGVFFSGAVA